MTVCLSVSAGTDGCTVVRVYNDTCFSV